MVEKSQSPRGKRVLWSLTDAVGSTVTASPSLSSGANVLVLEMTVRSRPVAEMFGRSRSTANGVTKSKAKTDPASHGQ